MIIDGKEDFPETILNGKLPYNIYLYWFDENLPTFDSVPFSHAYSLISAQYVPYLTSEDLRIVKAPYDVDRYGYKASGSTLKVPNVYRINVYENFDHSHPGTKEKKLGEFLCYQPSKNIGGRRSWRNESKLYSYPYSLAYLYDGLGDPIEIKYENCRDNLTEIYCRVALNVNVDYSIYLKNYLGDFKGEMEQNIVTSSRDYPCSSNQYSSWLATNKNSIQATKTNTLISSFQKVVNSSLIGATGGGIAGSIIPGAGNIAGASIGALMGAGSGILDVMRNSTSQTAHEKDMRNLPQSMINKGSDITLGINTTNQNLKLYRYRQKDEYINKIGDFFAMYGYKVNKLMKPNIRNRFYYNFIKTIQCNIETNAIPIQYIDIIKNIFNNGTTIWHVDRQGVKINNYDNDNYEV